MAIDTTASNFASNRAEAATDDARFSMADFLRVLDERRALIRNVALCFCALTLLVLLYLPTLYSTSAVVMLDQRKNNVADLTSVLSALPTDPSSVQNQIQLLSSRELALRVIDKLKLYDDPEFNPALAGGAPSISGILHSFSPANWTSPPSAPTPAGDRRDVLVSAFLSRLDVSALGLSTSITVTFTARNPETAARVVNALVEAYTADQVETKVEAARNATQWLTDRMHQLALQSQAEENAVAQYKAAHNLVESSLGASYVDQQMGAINTQLVDAQSDLAEKQAILERAQALVKSGNAADISQIVASPLIVKLRTDQAVLTEQLGELSTQFGPRHPKMIAIKSQIREADEKIAQEVARITGSIANDVAVARAHVGSIQASLARVEKQATGDSLARVKLNALEANVASTRTMYESFVSRLRATQDQDDIQNPEARIISRAPVPTAPSSPHRLLLFTASIPAGLMLGVLLALMAERFQAPLARQDLRPLQPRRAPVMARPAPTFAMPPILAELSATTDMRAAGLVIDQPDSPYSMAISGLLARMVRREPGRGTIVALTSPGGDPGKSVIALGLARSAASHGLRTILLDGDFERPGLARAMGFQPSNAGIYELLSGFVPLSRALAKDPRSNAYLLSAARPSAAAQSWWTTSKMAEMLSYLRQTCDLVIIDATPVLAPAGMTAISRLCDEVILVAQGGAPQAGLQGALQNLTASGARKLGLVITR